MSDPFDRPRLTDMKRVETQEPKKNLKNSKDKKESLCKASSPKPSAIQGNSSDIPQKKVPYLRLVVNNPPSPPSVLKKKLIETLSPDTGFTFRIEQKSPSQYVFVACDPFHCLEDVELLLTLDDDIDEDNLVFDEDGFIPEELQPSMTCCFPDIVCAKLWELVYEDETLYEAIIFNFQLKILRELLLFCSEETVSNLTILADEAPYQEKRSFKIYESLARFKDVVPRKGGTQTRLSICSTSTIYDMLVDIIDINADDFRETVWRHQRNNFAMRTYLKLNPTLKYFD